MPAMTLDKKEVFMSELRKGVQAVKKGDLSYLVNDRQRMIRFQPWLGDSLSIFYDLIMARSLFPRKFGSDMVLHYRILAQACVGVHGKRVLELGTGSGSAVHFLKPNNRYVGTDISGGLLRQAVKRFRQAGFEDTEFYVVSANDLPFERASFDLCLCILSLNFFGDTEKIFQGVKQVLATGGTFLCSIPVPERNRLQSRIRGTLHSEMEYKQICREAGFRYEPILRENGALLYFKAVKQETRK
jgi:ubiquinone/menaquinone biosynthesis C-methylase UbiE